MFATWGRFVARHRWPVLVVSVLLLGVSGYLLTQGGRLVTYEIPEDTETRDASRLIEDQIPAASAATVILVLSHPTREWTSGDFYAAAARTLAPLRADARVEAVVSPWDLPAGAAEQYVSQDGRRVLVVLSMRDDLVTATDTWLDVRAQIPETSLSVFATDEVAVYAEMNDILERDLVRAELVSLPLTLVLLLVVFGSVVAALLPLGVGILAVVGGTAAVMVASHFLDLSVYALNLVSLIGLGVAIDYSLFMVARFREELRVDGNVPRAVERTVATAGRAITFSGLTVAVGLSGLAFYHGLYFSTMGIAGAIVVTLAVFYGLTFQTALLSIIGHGVDRWSLPGRRAAIEGGRGFWDRLARVVMRRPVAFLVPTLLVLLLAGVPFLGIHMASVGVTALPESAEARQGFELLRSEFPQAGANVVPVVVDFGSEPLEPDRVGLLYDFSRRIATLDGVAAVQSVVDLEPSMSRRDYQELLSQPPDQMHPQVRSVVESSVGDTIVVLRVVSAFDAQSEDARGLVRTLRALEPPGAAVVVVGGTTALDIDMIDIIVERTPYALAFVVIVTYVLLLLQTGSVILPLKALLMNLLSITASFGALVWIFQWGNLSELLRFTPGPIDPGTPILLFCTVFGLSMDYEVLLLSRMHEEYEATGDNTAAVAGGLAKSGRLITSAAAIMVVVFGSFATAEVTVIKAVGLGLAIAIAVDATLVRALVVPSTMRLMGKWNWWAPRWVQRLWRAFG